MNNKDTKITRIYEGKYGDFSVTFCIKQGDITAEQKELLRAFWTTGETLDIEYKPHTAPDENQTDLIEELDKKKMSFDYNNYRIRCENYGVDYNALKEKLGVVHMRDLESRMASEDIATLLESELEDRLNTMNYWNN